MNIMTYAIAITYFAYVTYFVCNVFKYYSQKKKPKSQAEISKRVREDFLKTPDYTLQRKTTHKLRPGKVNKFYSKSSSK